jgi:MFS family permease
VADTAWAAPRRARYLLLPDWAPHRRRVVRALVDPQLLRGPVGQLAVAGSLSSITFLTLTSAVPVWLVRDRGLATDDPLIGWTLAVFSLAAGLGSLLGGFLAPRLGRRLVITGSLLATAAPLLALLHLEPGSLPFFVAAAVGGVLLYTSSPVMVVAAQDLAPQTPAAASGVVLGLSTGVAGALYVAFGKLQETIGLMEGMTVGLAMVIPSAAVALAVPLRHSLRPGGPQPRPAHRRGGALVAILHDDRPGMDADVGRGGPGSAGAPGAMGGSGACRSAPRLARCRWRWPSGRPPRPGSAGWSPCSAARGRRPGGRSWARG